MFRFRPFDIPAFAAALGSGLVAGIFFAFSSFVMPALGQVAANRGIDVMNALNRTVYTPSFMVAFWGTTVMCLASVVVALTRRQGPIGMAQFCAGGVFLIGCVGITAAFNVPMNEALAGAAPGTQHELQIWTQVLEDWTFWNHVRTGAALLSACLFTLVLVCARSGR
ncbi:DUF1772 domain-containing protein [Pacificispira sp.]|uniref:anthrone oxygenase family protein n=1 Tax=Pacificispira sp. TaxID=2888761 RepID=UPI003BA9EA88